MLLKDWRSFEFFSIRKPLVMFAKNIFYRLVRVKADYRGLKNG